MPPTTRAALIQCSTPHAPDGPGYPAAVKHAAIEKHDALIRRAAERGATVCCLQELFFAPYFPAEQDAKWYDLAEPIDGPTISHMRDLARGLGIVLIVPFYERTGPGILYNSAAVIAHTGDLLGVYRKHHLPHCHPGFWEKFYFRPGDGGYPVFKTPFGTLGVYICYDRHFPEGARALGLAGAQIVFNPSATVAGLSEHLWTLEQPALAVANQYFVGAINRVGVEKPWNIGEFYGSSYFCDPRGKIIAQAARSADEVLVADLDLAQIEEVRRVWQFFRDRRPETYPVE